jgi:hypothetical protein
MIHTYEAPGVPLVSVVAFDGEADLGVVVGSVGADGQTAQPTSILGLNPSRSVNAEEIAFGISALHPPSGRTTLGAARLIEIAQRATLAAVESAIGLDPASAAVISQKVGHAVTSALAKFEFVADAPLTIGSVFIPPGS